MGNTLYACVRSQQQRHGLHCRAAVFLQPIFTLPCDASLGFLLNKFTRHWLNLYKPGTCDAAAAAARQICVASAR